MNYQKHYDTLIHRAKNRLLNEYTDSHHILPRCMGGTDDVNNIVELTPEEHYVAHQLLVKIYPNISKLVMAARYMCYGNEKNGKRKNNKLYGWLKRKHAEVMREINTGRKQSQETIEKRNKSNTGKKRTEETKKKMSDSQSGRIGKPHTEETKKKISKNQSESFKNGRIPGMLGKHHTEEHRQKMSEMFKGRDGTPSTQKGVPKSKETKQKMSESKLGKKREGFIPWNKGIPLSEEAKQSMGKKNSENLKGRSWEDIYGVEGAATRREKLRLNRLAKEGGSN
jgi:hypothetical protein